MKTRCDDLEPVIEAIADGSQQPGADESAHLASCAVCTARLNAARAIDNLLAMRAAAAPAAAFTAAVMARVGQEQWKAERAIDLGFNLAIAAGVLVILAGGAGLAWSLGFLNITIDLETVWQAVGADVADRVVSQAQTFVIAAVLLTMALALWWWAETATD